MFYGVVALDHQAMSGQLSVPSVTNVTAFCGGITLTLVPLFSSQSPESVLLKWAFETGSNLRPFFWGGLRKAEQLCPSTFLPLEFCPLGFPSLLPSYCEASTHGHTDPCVRSLWLTGDYSDLISHSSAPQLCPFLSPSQWRSSLHLGFQNITMICLDMVFFYVLCLIVLFNRRRASSLASILRNVSIFVKCLPFLCSFWNTYK